ncbi:TrmB family transcriptional regulator [Halobacteriales archaeon QS_4_69_225]|nr:MAG: TrmB family transcriptional regulator [Halobacteriales archaeon QS_4_69_225]
MTKTDGTQLLESLELKEYERTALDQLLRLGRTTAPNLAEASGIPKARVYGVLESLGDEGFIEIIPGRPKEYQPKAPEEILQRAKANRRQVYEAYCREIDSVSETFLNHYRPLYETATSEISPTEELFRVVNVGEPSLRETREIYRDTDTELDITTKSFEYLVDVELTLRETIDRGVDVSVLFVHPSHLTDENSRIQAEIVDRIDAQFPKVAYRFSEQRLPWRGTLADPSLEYETGTAILLVEEKDIPLHMRQAAVTDNEAFVAGMSRYFSLIWEHDSVELSDR